MYTPGASSARLKILIGNSSATSVATTKRPNPSSGLTPKLIGAFAQPRNQCNAALVPRCMQNHISINRDTYLRLLFMVPAICMLGFTGCSSVDAGAGKEIPHCTHRKDGSAPQ